jgi:carbon monoxide dehydrogenase subunit G
MARYLVSVRTPRSPEEAFRLLADLSRFESWHPAVVSSQQIHGRGPGPDTSYRMKVAALGRTMMLDSRVTEFDEPSRVVAVASTSWFRLEDTITVEPDGAGSIVTYDTEMILSGLARVGRPLLGLALKRIGDPAAVGLARALDGERVRR